MNDKRCILSSVPPDFLKSMLISPVTAHRVPKSCCYYTRHCIGKDHYLFFSWDSFSNSLYDKSQRGLTTKLNSAFGCWSTCCRLNWCVVAAPTLVCVCMEALIRGLERYTGAACPPLLCFSSSALSWLAGCPHYCQSASGLAVPGSSTALCPPWPARTSLPDCCHWYAL